MEIKDMVSTIMSNAIALSSAQVTAIATFVTALFIIMQWLVFKKQRRDNLFILRYKLYKEIIEFIPDIIQHRIDDGYLPEIDPDVTEVYHNAKVQDLVMEAKWLYDAKLADWLKKVLCDKKVCLWGKIGTYDYENSIWLANKEFQDKFDRFLKLK
jgi:hypothetical protein